MNKISDTQPATATKPSLLVKSKELCELLNIDKRTLQRWLSVENCPLPKPIVLFGTLQWDRATLMRFLNDKNAEAQKMSRAEQIAKGEKTRRRQHWRRERAAKEEAASA